MFNREHSSNAETISMPEPKTAHPDPRPFTGRTAIKARFWRWPSVLKVHSINTQADFVEPFFNHHAGDTRSRNPV
jgi:hypothetical protein